MAFGTCVSAKNKKTSTVDASPIRVSHTIIRLDIRDFNTHILKGKTTQTVHSKTNGLTSIPLKLLCLNVDSVWINATPTTAYTYNDTTICVSLPTPLTTSDSVDVTISYHGTPHVEEFGGFGFYDENRMAHNMGVSFDDKPHNYGKSWYPCIDDFCSRSIIEGYYQTSIDRKAIGNGLLQSVDTITTGIVDNAKTDSSLVWHWKLNQPIPDYLCNVAVADYQNIHLIYNNGTREIPIDAYVLREDVEEMKKLLDWAPKTLAIMEKHFGPYVWDRVGYVAVNSPSGAMEHATNISIPLHPKSNKYYCVDFIVHELIHHWFGDLATCKTAGDMWLNEGITSYMVEVVAEECFPEKALERCRREIDSWQKSCPQGSKEYHSLTNMPLDLTYGDITYYKGAWVMRQLRKELGDDLFFKAMKDYVQTYSFRNASCKDFKQSLEKSTGRKLTGFFKKYIYK